MRFLFIFTIAASILAYGFGGTAPFGRILLSLGLPGLALPLFEDPEWRGVAAFETGDSIEASKAFRQSGSFYNLGNAEAFAGNYATALESYDRAILEGNKDAEANFDLVAAYYAGLEVDPEALGLVPKRKTGPNEESFVARGDAKAAGTGSDVTNSNTMLGLAELDSRGRLGVRRIFDDSYMLADKRWLAHLSDVPGEYLSARILQEHKRRMKLGLSPEPPEDPR